MLFDVGNLGFSRVHVSTVRTIAPSSQEVTADLLRKHTQWRHYNRRKTNLPTDCTGVHLHPLCSTLTQQRYTQLS